MSRVKVNAGVVGLVVATVLALGVAQWVTRLLPIGEVSARPFQRQGVVGSEVTTRAFRVTVTEVGGAPQVHSSSAGDVRAYHRFLYVVLKVRAEPEPTRIGGLYLLTADGRVFTPARVGCAGSLSVATGLDWWGATCFDLPREAWEGARLQVSVGDWTADGGAQRYDDVADVDLGLDRGAVDEAWAERATFNANGAEGVPIELPLRLPEADEG